MHNFSASISRITTRHATSAGKAYILKYAKKNMVIKDIPWLIEPHTEAKHEILKKYLQVWMAILSRFNSKIIYLDGFAGPGEYLYKEKGKVDGSPIIAIESFLKHKLKDKIKNILFIFIEHEDKIFNYLQNKLEPYKKQGLNIQLIRGEFDKIINEKLDNLENEGNHVAPMFCFIDPFGIKGVSLDTIKRIMDNKSYEVFINFMYEELNRFITLPQNEIHITALFGENQEWKKIKNIEKSADRYIYLTNLYQKMLKERCSIKYISTFKMINKYNKEDYVLFFCTNNELGLKKMKESMWKVDATGNFNFSDATYDPNQMTLFEHQPNYNTLKKMILYRYKGKLVSIEELINFVWFETPFLEPHLRKPILDKMYANNEIEIMPQPKRKGTYPSGTIIKFK